MTRLLLKLGTGNELTEEKKLKMDKNIALILALLLTPSTIFMFCMHYSSPVPRAPFSVSRSPYSAYQALPIELLCERWSETVKEMK